VFLFLTVASPGDKLHDSRGHIARLDWEENVPFCFPYSITCVQAHTLNPTVKITMSTIMHFYWLLSVQIVNNIDSNCFYMKLMQIE
jgi:hypothetical protein